jgi:hypothetical protein
MTIAEEIHFGYGRPNLKYILHRTIGKVKENTKKNQVKGGKWASTTVFLIFGPQGNRDLLVSSA